MGLVLNGLEKGKGTAAKRKAVVTPGPEILNQD
jgi:hypothetical protein